jgi:hypothetical protein
MGHDIWALIAGSGDALHEADVREAQYLPLAALGHQTCLTTMQELWDEALTPNATIHRLIAAWFSRRYTRFKKCFVDFHDCAAHLIHDIHSSGVVGGPRAAIHLPRAHGGRHQGQVLLRILQQPLPDIKDKFFYEYSNNPSLLQA